MAITATIVSVDRDFDYLQVRVCFESDVTKPITKTYMLRHPQELTLEAIQDMVRVDKERLEAIEAVVPTLSSYIGSVLEV